MNLLAPKGLLPDYDALRVKLQQPAITVTTRRPEGLGVSRHDISAIRGLPARDENIIIGSTIGLAPLYTALVVEFEDPAVEACHVTSSKSCANDDVATI